MSHPLEDLLDQVRDALVGGNLAGLAPLTERIESLATGLGGLDRPAARRLHQKAERNARLLTAASRGVKSARQRLADIADTARLSTYDAQGRRALIAAPSLTPLRRA